MILYYNPKADLPSAKDLPDSDETPVDNELQDLIPGLLKAMLALIWPERMDWFFGVDMGIYHHPEKPAIVPDGFLSIGVPRIIDSNLRLSYVLWEEQKPPTFVLEVVSQTRRKEYTEKKAEYAQLGISYYAIYNPLRKRKPRLEVYQLQGGEYEQISGEEPFWLPGINLGLGRGEGTYQGIAREWLYWYNEQGERYLTPEEQLLSAKEQTLQAQRQTLEAQQQAREAQEQVAKLAEKLRELGIDPSSLG
ncbi:Uma2 family endonuclease [Roseofilum sp. BLCC_M91]|uniref:Uma2 family endonuclease n=1 Tax=Roseofilum halophilum BLCC-M91 TaxID=3022259 RepID=A0ABT7BQ82_9CYAN|nr:Uma2 family endonuclease [Roseofilum halophilum]MDJ1181351.1 Uma2 family endonuclease [Roseofilum halophilum BLCC-M91]